MNKAIEILEVGPRDGLQNETRRLPLSVRVELVRRLVMAGIRRVEVASFVNPKRVPQMADAEELLAALPREPSVTYVGLVLNRRGFERALAAGCHEVGMAVVATDTFSRRNQGMSTEEALAQWLEIAAIAREANIRAQVTVLAAFGCPFEGEVPMERVIEIARCAAVGDPHEICFADTIGAAVPVQVTELLSRVRDVLPDSRLRCHFHNTRNTGMANAQAAVQNGVRALDASVGGIGGCPFAPAATGNIPTEDLVYMLERSRIETGVSLDGLIDTAKWLGGQLERVVPGMLSKAGPFPRPLLSDVSAK